MSNICFRDLQEEAYVGGRERHQCAWLVRHLFESLVDLPGIYRYLRPFEQQQFLQLLGCTEPVRLDLALHDIGGPREIAGRSWETFTMALNTALAFGSDPVRLAARVHGQCEVHGFVEGAYRNWLADIIDEGLGTRILRRETQGYGAGWEDVARLLRARADGPVVMSFSGCDSFPEQPRDADDDWYNIPLEQRDHRPAVQWQLRRHLRREEPQPAGAGWDWRLLGCPQYGRGLDLRSAGSRPRRRALRPVLLVPPPAPPLRPRLLPC